MGKKYKLILYILIIVLLAGGVGLFLWRDNLINNINENSGIVALETIVKTEKTSEDTLDTSIFSDAKFTSLKNNVVKFDFDLVCKDSSGKVATVAVVESTETQATSTSTSTPAAVKPTGCLIGNSIPFPVPAKK